MLIAFDYFCSLNSKFVPGHCNYAVIDSKHKRKHTKSRNRYNYNQLFVFHESDDALNGLSFEQSQMETFCI